MRTLVTGCAGFIGSNLVKRLEKDGHEVVGVDDLSAGSRTNLDDTFWYEADITNYDVMDRIIGKHRPEVIFHNAASKKNICLKDPHRDLEVNAGGTLKLLQLAYLHKIPKFIHASTGSVYGEVNGQITENTPTNPVSYYGVSKLAAEGYVKYFSKMMDTTILRYFHVYGQRQDSSQDKGGVIAIFIKNLLTGRKHTIFGDGSQTRSFTYVDDVVEANIKAVDTPGIYNVASGTKIRLIDVVSEISRISGLWTGTEYKRWQDGDIKNFDVSNEKITNELGITWTPLQKGLTKTILDQRITL